MASWVLAAAAQDLLGQIERLAQEQTARIRAAQPEYAPGAPVADDDLLNSCRTNLTSLISDLAGLPVANDPLEPARAVGRRRAEQGVPLEAVLRAFSQGGRGIWEELLQHAPGGGAGRQQADALLLAAGAVWRVVEEHSLAVSQAYRETERRLQDRGRRTQQAALDALLAGAGADPDRAVQLSRTLGLRPGALLVVLYEDLAGPSPVEQLQAQGLHVDWTVHAEAHVALVCAQGRSAEALRELLVMRTAGRVALSPLVPGVADLAHALRAAQLAWSTLPQGQDAVVLLADRLVDALVLASPRLADELVAHVARPLLDLGEEGVELLDTVAEFLQQDGSAGAAARGLYVHRNTVHARLSRVERLCGVGLASTADRVLWSLALVALGRRPG